MTRDELDPVLNHAQALQELRAVGARDAELAAFKVHLERGQPGPYQELRRSYVRGWLHGMKHPLVRLPGYRGSGSGTEAGKHADALIAAVNARAWAGALAHGLTEAQLLELMPEMGESSN